MTLFRPTTASFSQQSPHIFAFSFFCLLVYILRTCLLVYILRLFLFARTFLQYLFECLSDCLYVYYHIYLHSFLKLLQNPFFKNQREPKTSRQTKDMVRPNNYIVNTGYLTMDAPPVQPRHVHVSLTERFHHISSHRDLHSL